MPTNNHTAVCLILPGSRFAYGVRCLSAAWSAYGFFNCSCHDVVRHFDLSFEYFRSTLWLQACYICCFRVLFVCFSIIFLSNLICSYLLLHCPVSADQVIGRAIMVKPGCCLALQFRNDALGQNLAQFHAPLVERVDVPYCALGEYAMFVKGDKFAQCFRRQPLGKDRV